MSEINFTRKTFLEREELNRLQEFLRDDIAFNAVVGNTRQYGIIQTEFVGNDTNFQVGTGTNAGTIQIAKEQSQAIDIDGNLIRLLARDNIAVTDDSNWYWVRISHEFRRFEEGTVSLNSNGQLTGIGTSFLEVLRGQATDVPVRIRFVELDGTTPTNNGTYEVVNVVDDTNAVLTSLTAFQNESNLRYIVIGSTPIGEIVSTEQLEGLYNYDSCQIELVQETVADTPPALPANGANRYFYIARVMNTSGTLTIQDRRDFDENYWRFNIPGIAGAIIMRNLPAPTALNNYMMLGYIGNASTQVEHFLVSGVGAFAGYLAWVRLGRVNTAVAVTDVRVLVINDNANVDQNPSFHYRNNITDNRIELWVESPDELLEAGFELSPGSISLVSEELGGGATAWVYADSFTWTGTAPTSLVAARTSYGVYAGDETEYALDTELSNIRTSISGRLERNLNLGDLTNTSSARLNLSVYSRAEVDAGTARVPWTTVSPEAGVNVTGDIQVCKIGPVIYVSGEFELTGGIFDGDIVYVLPNTFPAFTSANVRLIGIGVGSGSGGIEFECLIGTRNLSTAVGGGANQGRAVLNGVIPVI